MWITKECGWELDITAYGVRRSQEIRKRNRIARVIREKWEISKFRATLRLYGKL